MQNEIPFLKDAHLMHHDFYSDQKGRPLENEEILPFYEIDYDIKVFTPPKQEDEKKAKGLSNIAMGDI